MLSAFVVIVFVLTTGGVLWDYLSRRKAKRSADAEVELAALARSSARVEGTADLTIEAFATSSDPDSWPQLQIVNNGPHRATDVVVTAEGVAQSAAGPGRWTWKIPELDPPRGERRGESTDIWRSDVGLDVDVVVTWRDGNGQHTGTATIPANFRDWRQRLKPEGEDQGGCGAGS